VSTNCAQWKAPTSSTVGSLFFLLVRVLTFGFLELDTTFLTLYNVTDILPKLTRPLVDQVLKTAGYDVCSDLLPNGEAVEKLNDRPTLRGCLLHHFDFEDRRAGDADHDDFRAQGRRAEPLCSGLLLERPSGPHWRGFTELVRNALRGLRRELSRQVRIGPVFCLPGLSSVPALPVQQARH
jgi:hypothetical protein